ncbi:MAG: carbamoyltransferase HypF [Acidobacteriota bacterium]|jgi:hydrogenase maturation protein HypF|nr:carbamoyltransferase HypF [Acidobacteriota bacterium]
MADAGNDAGRVLRRIRVVIRGAVQGVGFRPFVYRLASEMRLSGWVRNSSQGVFVEAEGEKSALDEFLLRLSSEKPAHAFIQSLEYSLLEPVRHRGFAIRESEESPSGAVSALVLPDIAVCDQCLAEMRDPADRRYRYPFINCTHCGPRFSIIEALPYDRPSTSMKSFALCPDCRREYEDPRDRRFHAQPTACPVCGPELALWDEKGREVARRDDALLAAAGFIRRGGIAAVKGLGGFHLVCDARNAQAVGLLRKRKLREEKPFALMYPSLAAVAGDCRVTPMEARLLQSPEAPIVLLEKIGDGGLDGVAPDNPCLGVMLPATPLHHLLLTELGFPVVATSGNLSDEPICIDEREALTRLAGIADCFLVHDRPIVRHVDDSIIRIVLGRELVLRRARGYAPLPLPVKDAADGTLAVGGHLKNAIAIATGGNVFLSQHIGDLEGRESIEAFHRVIASFRRLYQVEPVRVAADRHPDYFSTKAAEGFGVPVVNVQHHHAHVAACMVENELEGQVLGVAWDGTGYGLDGTIWGGEFLLADTAGFQRVAALRGFRLPGGDAAVREPRRAALGVLYEIFGSDALNATDDVADAATDLPPVGAFTVAERAVIAQMLAKGVHSPVTTSAGRLFDAVAALSGIRQKISFEGQAAMQLEFAAMRETTAISYPFDIASSLAAEHDVVDWEPMIRAIADDVRAGVAASLVARKFHNTMAEIIVAVAQRQRRQCRQIEDRVILTGGCFQNRILLEETVRKLQNAGFRPFWHQRVPPGDGGIALGQIAVASRRLKSSPGTRTPGGQYDQILKR